MEKSIKGLHHITAIASDPQINYDFYNGVLGLRMVKKTVNFDAPDVYHLYYGDETGTPGTILTFFFFPGAGQGVPGAGEVSSIAFSVPSRSLNYWKKRFEELDIKASDILTKMDGEYISVEDPDGLQLEIVADPTVDEIPGWKDGPVEPEQAIRKFYGAGFTVKNVSGTTALMSDIMGLIELEPYGEVRRFSTGNGNDHAIIELREVLGEDYSVSGAGSVHHIAWRTSDGREQLHWMKKISRTGIHTTEVIDRLYFHSIYFREPGGILFEIATDPPGFLVDEELECLGTKLLLPPWYEGQREQIERSLKPFDTRADEDEKIGVCV